jgi:hypothetical protein
MYYIGLIGVNIDYDFRCWHVLNCPAIPLQHTPRFEITTVCDEHHWSEDVVFLQLVGTYRYCSEWRSRLYKSNLISSFHHSCSLCDAGIMWPARRMTKE